MCRARQAAVVSERYSISGDYAIPSIRNTPPDRDRQWQRDTYFRRQSVHYEIIDILAVEKV
jgi:hypothetical protein